MGHVLRDHAGRPSAPAEAGRHPKAASRLVACAVAGVVVMGTANASADERRPNWQLDFAAPPGCSTAADFVKQVERRREHPATSPDERRTRLRVDIRTSPHGALGRLTLSDADGHSSERSIEAADCRAAAEALALVAALAIDRGETASQASSPAPAPATTTTPPAATAPSAAPAGSTPSTPAAPPPAAAPPSAPPPAAAPPPAPPPAPAPAPVTLPPASEAVASIHVDSDATPRASSRMPVAFSASVEGLVAGGMAPEATGAWMALAGVMFGKAWRTGRPTVRIGVAGAPSLPFVGPDGTASFGWIAAVLEACPVALALLRDVVVVRPCGVAEYGVVRASGTDTLNPASVSRPWAGAGLGLRFSWRILGPLSLQASFSGLGAIERNRFLIAGQEVFETPTTVARVGLGLGVDIP